VQNLSKLRSTFRKLCFSTMLIHSQKRDLSPLQKVRGRAAISFRCFLIIFTCGGFTLNNDRRCLREKFKNNYFFFIIAPQANVLPQHKKYISALSCFCDRHNSEVTPLVIEPKQNNIFQLFIVLNHCPHFTHHPPSISRSYATDAICDPNLFYSSFLTKLA